LRGIILIASTTNLAVLTQKKRLIRSSSRPFISFCHCCMWSTGKPSPTISAKPVGVWAGSQPSIVRDEQSGSLNAHRGDGQRFAVRAD